MMEPHAFRGQALAGRWSCRSRLRDGPAAWIRASITNGWLGTPVLNPVLERAAARQRRLIGESQAMFINRA
jgi:hypothetical protein